MYGNHGTLGNKWKDKLIELAFTPCLQYQYAAGKNTADIALALDAMELLFDEKVSTFCLVTSDSDFAHLCRKLRDRGSLVCIVGEDKTPLALRNSSDHFSEWSSATSVDANSEGLTDSGAVQPKAIAAAATIKPAAKRRPRFVVEAVTLLAGNTSEGRVDLSALGNYLRRTDSSFSPKAYGHSGLLDMLRTYDLLEVVQETGGHGASLSPKHRPMRTVGWRPLGDVFPGRRPLDAPRAGNGRACGGRG